MTVVTPDYRVAAGTLTAAALAADAGSVVADWASARPQGWRIASTIVESHISVQTGLNGVSRGYGLLHWTWTIVEMDGAMVDVLRTELFPNGILTNEAVTAKTPGKGWAGGSANLVINASVTWPGLQRILLNPKPGDLFTNVVLQFFNGEIAASGA